ncbi:MAG TPA: urate oxidase [Nocardioides sp.]|jgi:urate oxidase|nr:urate oxidase [Nocardioides sp.]
MAIVLGDNRYGKAETRVVRIVRDTPRHEIRDRNVSTALRGDFADAHETGDQAHVLPTDTQKNTVYAYAQEYGDRAAEEYAAAVADRLLEASPYATSAQVRVEEYAWDRVPVGPDGHDHSFVRRGTETRTCAITVEGRGDDRRLHVLSGLTDLTVLKSTGSEFKGFLQDRFTTLAETDDRVLATSLTAWWRWGPEAPTDWDAAYESVRAVLLETFATTYSRALQETLQLMGRAVLEAQPELAEIRFSAPNKHHFVVDLSPFGMENPGEVFHADDRPYGLIEAQVRRDDAPDAAVAWRDIAGFV